MSQGDAVADRDRRHGKAVALQRSPRLSRQTVIPDKPRSIVTYVHRPKRPPRKTAQAAAIAGPTRIVTAKSALPDMTPEEHKQRGDAADALFRELVRQATGKLAPYGLGPKCAGAQR
jgi:hypothetical protein